MDKKVSKASRKIAEYYVLIPYLRDYKAGFHIRHIAREMKMNHRTVALALERMEKQGIVKYRTEGRNKVYYINSEKPYLAKPYIRNAESQKRAVLDKKPLMMELMSCIFLPPVAGDTPIILFGSYAKGEKTGKSDIDLMLIGENKKVIKELEKFGLKYGKKIHIMALGKKEFEKRLDKKDHLLFEIAANHIILNNEYGFVEIMWRHFYG